MKRIMFFQRAASFLFLLFSISVFLPSCTTGGAAQAQEYFSIGMAYYDMGKFDEAERWLNRARAADRTMTASEYNLGRIAFETGRYEEAAGYFENILELDPENIMALKGAAYSRIKNGDLAKAEILYSQVLALVPESADNGFNYALVLYALEKYPECEEVLAKYPFALEENAASVLLYARAQKAQNKVEAVDSYAKWLLLNTGGTVNAGGIYEYAQVLESASLFAMALEQYKAAIAALTEDADMPLRSQIRFEEARLLLAVDPDNSEGMSELNLAIDEGFTDTAAMEPLLTNEQITQGNKDEIRRLIYNILNPGEAAEDEAVESSENETDETGEARTSDS